MRDVTKIVKLDIDGEEMQFKITKMNAFDGTWLMKYATEKILPLYNDISELLAPVAHGDSGKELTEAELNKKVAERMNKITETIPAALMKISRDDLIVLMSACLNTVEALLPAGWRKIMDGQDFMVPELEYDIMGTLALCYEVIVYNLAGFFGEGRLTSLLKRLRSRQ